MTDDDQGVAGELDRLARSAWIYGFPMVFDLEEVVRFTTEGLGALPATPFNEFGHATALAGADDTFVSVNNDTIYSIAQLDLGGGPLLLHVPDTGGAYFVLQFVDAWTNNVAYVGRRATGTAEGTFLLTPPGWDGDGPAGASRIPVPTRVATIVGRWACDGEADLPRVRALQEGLTLTPVDRDAPPPAGVPVPDPDVPDELRFWEEMRVWMAAFPPAPDDVARQQAFAPLGLLGAGPSPYGDGGSDLARTLVAAADGAHAELAAALRSGAGDVVNGWQLTFHMFDYNVDFFGVGTIDSPEWRIDDRPEALRTRAAAAMAGLWGNHGYEAAYVMTYVDGDGDPLTGDHAYTLRFAPPPPVGAFWSVTMYDVPDFFLVANPIDRYSIGDRTPGLVTAPDGSITITLSAAPPDDPQVRANWLPAPAGAFRPMLRLYTPDEAILDGRYVIPPIVRVA